MARRSRYGQRGASGVIKVGARVVASGGSILAAVETGVMACGGRRVSKTSVATETSVATGVVVIIVVVIVVVRARKIRAVASIGS